MGDTELVHMSKPEIKGLASLGELTINPDTGLPEAFKLKSILPTVAGIGAAFATGGTSLLIPAVATGLTSAIVNKDIGRGLFDGLLSYAGGSIMRGLSGGGEAFGELATQTAPAAVAPTAGQAVGQAAQNFTASQLTDIAGGFAPAGLSGELVAGQAAEAALSPGLAALPSSGATIMPPVFTAAKEITPSFVGRQLGYETIKQGATLTPMQVAQLGGGTAGLTTSQMAGLYAPQAAVGVGGAMLQDAMTPEYPEPELISETVSTPRTPRTLTRTPLRSTPVTEEEALAAALGTGPGLRFSDYTTRYANQGGLVDFATGGFLEALAKGEQVPGALGSLPPHVARGLMENPEIGTDGAAFRSLVNSQPSTKDLMGGQALDALGSLPPHVARGLMENPEVLNDATAFSNLVHSQPINSQPSIKDLMGSSSFFKGLPPHVVRGLMENPEILNDATAFSNLVHSQPLTKDLMGGGRPHFEGMVPGDAHGMKDNVAFKVQGGNIDTAMLSPGEYVVPADVVAMLGNGNGDSGAKELDAFAKGIRQKAFGTEKQQKQINAPKELGQLATA
jgi:hypothetical protein